MPLEKKIILNDTKIAIWSVEESLEELLKLCGHPKLSQFKTTKRKKEFLSIRLLLKNLLPNNKIWYNAYGAPEIGNDNFISISHSNKLTAIIVSKKKVGLDIEKISKKPLKLSAKFINKEFKNPISEEKATLIWSCKEAIFKWHQKGNVNFLLDIQIMPFTIKNQGNIIAKFQQNKITLNYQRINTHFLVYVCN